MLAKNLKEQEEILKRSGQQLYFLEQKKAQAIKNEDYESAMVIK